MLDNNFLMRIEAIALVIIVISLSLSLCQQVYAVVDDEQVGKCPAMSKTRIDLYTLNDTNSKNTFRIICQPVTELGEAAFQATLNDTYYLGICPFYHGLNY